MAGSDRVPDPDDSKRAQVGNAQTTTRAKWRSSLSAYRSVLQNVLDTADIVRDGYVSPTTSVLKAHENLNEQRRVGGARVNKPHAPSSQARITLKGCSSTIPFDSSQSPTSA